MSRSDFAKFNLLAMAATCAPLLLVGLGPTLLGSGPRLSMAAGVEDAQDAGGPAPARRLNDRERSALARAEKGLSGGEIVSPFRPVPVAETPDARPEKPAAPVLAAGLAQPEVSLRMIVRRSDGVSQALIGGKMLVAGDEVADGWTIETVDGDTRAVTFVSRDGQRFTVNLK